MRQFFASMSARARIAFATGVLVVLVVAAGIAWWAAHPPYGLLFSDLREADAAEITATLGQLQVPYRLADGGQAIMVPADQVYDTRMKLVSAGVPKGGTVGFELFKDSDYGVTEFAQKVNFQRALQGELERTIGSLGEVASARVHLTIRRADLFGRDEEASKGSVALTLRPGAHIDAREVAGIQRLVASAVERLAPESVTVIDAQGNVLSRNSGNAQGAFAGDHLDEERAEEAQLRGQVGDLLERALHTRDFSVSVDVRMNYDQVKQVSDRLLSQGKDGNGLLLRERVDGAAHVPATPEGSAAPTGGGHREVEYAHGREQREVVRAQGQVERISVGVVIPADLSGSRIDALSRVISAGIGLDPSRGDTIDIAAVAPTAVSTAAATSAAPVGAVRHVRVAQHGEIPRRVDYEAIALAVAVLIVLLVAGAWVSSRRQPRRLTGAQREEMLLRLRHWIETAEVER